MRRPARFARSATPLGAAARTVGGALLLAAATFGPYPAPALAQIQMEGENETNVRRVDIVGNVAYQDGTLKSILRTRSTSFFRPWRSAPLRPDFLRYDRQALRDFYRRHGYLRADVESVQIVYRDKSSAEVRFHVAEGPHARVDAIDFEGLSASDEEDIRSVIPLEAGGLFDFPAVEVSHAAIDSFFAERGNVIADVRDSVEVSGDNVRVRFRIDPGPVALLRTTVVEGTRTTKPGFVSREVVLRPGDVLSRSRLLQSQQRIYDSGLYGDVQFSTSEIDLTTKQTDLIVTVRERRHGWVDGGVGYGTGTVRQARLTAQLGQRNLFRDGVAFVATGRIGVQGGTKPQFPYVDSLSLGDRRVDLTLTRKWLLGIRVQGTIGVYAEEAPGLTETKIPLRAVGASAGLRYGLSRWSSASLSYEIRRVNSDSASVKDQVGTPLKRYTRNSIAATIERDSRLDLFDPKHGTVAIGSAELVGGVLRGNSQYVKLTGSVTKYRPLTRRLTFALRGRAGIIASRGQGPAEALVDSISDLDLIPEEDRFRTGGATTVRGYQEDEIGTQVLFTTDTLGVVTSRDVRRGGAYILQGNAEVRARLVGFLGAAAFLDGGGVWENPDDISWRRIFSFSNGAGYKDMRWVAGLGVRIATPVGPVRLDYGWKLRIARTDRPDAATGRGGFAFSLGQAY